MGYPSRIYYSESDRQKISIVGWRASLRMRSLVHSDAVILRFKVSWHALVASRRPKRRRSRHALSMAEREEISRGIVAGRSMRAIAAALGRAPSTVSRELQRNGGRRRYRANRADKAAWDRAHRPKTCKLASNRVLARVVASKLQLEWAPDQIAGWLKRTYADDVSMQVSHETIYKTLFIQARGALKKELQQYLRKTRALRRSRHKTLKDEGLARSPTQYRSVSVPLRWKTEPCQATGGCFCGNYFGHRGRLFPYLRWTRSTTNYN